VFFPGNMEPTVKYYPLRGYNLTSREKPYWDSIWWAVLVGRYPPKK